MGIIAEDHRKQIIPQAQKSEDDLRLNSEVEQLKRLKEKYPNI